MAGGGQGAWRAGEVVGSHVVGRVLGSGGMATVYEGRHQELGSQVAIKVLAPEYSANPDLRARFLREGRAAARIQHPNVVRVFDVGARADAPYLVMEYLEGRNLHAHLAALGALSVEETLDLMLPVLAAMQAAHDEGVVHRDLKPSNIFLARLRDGGVRPVVVDFGIASVGDAEPDGVLTKTDMLMGTPAYLSPEQTRGLRDLTPASDQFTLGAILYECVTGRPAFEGASLYEIMNRVATVQFASLRTYRPDLHEAFEAAVLRAMALRPEARFGSVRELGQALLPLASAKARLLIGDGFVSEDETTRVRGSRPSHVAARAPNADAGGRRGPDTTLGGSAVALGARGAGAAKGARRWWVGAALAGVVAVGGAAWVALDGRDGATARAREYRVVIEVVPRTARIVIDGREVGRGRFEGRFASDGRAHAMVVEAEGYEPDGTTFVNAPPAVTRFELRRIPPPPVQEFPVVIEAVPPTATIAIDGREVGRGRAEGRFARDGRTHSVLVTAAGYAPRNAEFTDRPPDVTRIVLQEVPRDGRRPHVRPPQVPTRPPPSPSSTQANPGDGPQPDRPPHPPPPVQPPVTPTAPAGAVPNP